MFLLREPALAVPPRCYPIYEKQLFIMVSRDAEAALLLKPYNPRVMFEAKERAIIGVESFLI